MSRAEPMSDKARLAVYHRQGRSWRLTPAQRRRSEKKERAALARAEREAAS